MTTARGRRGLRALRAEWTKLRTLRSTGWLLVLAIATTVALGFALTGWLSYDDCQSPCRPDMTKLSLAGVRLGQVGIVILAVLTVTAEYSTRTIQPTLMAMPYRLRVVLAKLGVLCVLAVAAGAAGVAGSLAAARYILPRNGFTPANGFGALSLADDLVLRAAIGTVLYIGLITLMSAGLGFLLRDTAGAITAALALLYGSPVVATFVTDPRWQHRIHRFSPMDAGLAIQSTQGSAEIGPWAGLGVLSLYAAAAVVAGAVVFRLRDAR